MPSQGRLSTESPGVAQKRPRVADVTGSQPSFLISNFEKPHFLRLFFASGR